MIKKITSVLYFLLIVWVFASNLNQQTNFVDWISDFTVLLFLISSIGDAFNYNLGKRTSWQRSWVVSIIYNLSYIFYLDHRYGAQHGSPSNDLAGFLIFLPVIYMSYHFAFSSRSGKRKIITHKKLQKKKYHKGRNNERLNDESFIIVLLRKIKIALKSDWQLPPSTIVMESAIADHKTSIHEEPEQDYEQISTHILKLESLSNNNKLTKSTIERYQELLDKLSAKFVYDESLDYLYCGFYELQALIYLAEGDATTALKFMNEAADVKQTDQNFISVTAQVWSEENKSHSVKASEERYHQTVGKKHFSKRTKIIFWGVIAVIALLVIAANPISDYLTIKGANPTMLKLARDADMTRKGELLFLRTNPQLVNDTQMAQFCPDAQTNNSGFIEQGCFVPNQSDPTTGRIYLRQMSSDLYDLEVTTAAYEMLHPAYASLIINSSSALNSDIESNYTSVNDPTIAANVALFAKTEPGAKDDELFSMLGTSDYDSLSASLQSYYTPYLTNPDVVVGDNNQVNALFQDDLSQLTQLQNTITTDNNNANTAYADSVSWANDGNQYEDTYNYNIYTQDYNDAGSAIDQYNALLQQYNVLVTEFNGQQFNPDSPAQTQ